MSCYSWLNIKVSTLVLTKFCRLWCLPIVIKSKYYPIFLLALFTCISFTYKWQFFVSFAVGYLYVFGLMPLFNLSLVKATYLEGIFPFNKLSNFSSNIYIFISILS